MQTSIQPGSGPAPRGAVRRWLRPLACQLRDFLTGTLQQEVAALRDEVAALRAELRTQTPADAALEQALLTLALEREEGRR